MTQPHNEMAAKSWGHAGGAYDFISFGLSDGLSHAVQKLWPKPGERILDVATGTGWTARLLAQMGAEVTAVDIADPLLTAAQELSSHLPIDFQHADAEALPFDDACFDALTSTYGVMFAGDQKQAAREMARVLKPGGRMVLTTWLAKPESYIPAFFGLIGKYAGAPAPDPSPMNWGNTDWLAETLTDDFDYVAEGLTTTLYAPNTDVLWDKYIHGFGSMAMVADSIPAEGLSAFREDFKALHAPYDTGRGLKIDRDAVLISAVRK